MRMFGDSSKQIAIKPPGLFVKIRLGLLVCTFAFLRPQELQAQVTIDVAKITCRQYLSDRTISPWAPRIVTWLSGYFNGMRNDTTIDIGLVRINRNKIEDYCRMNPDTTLLDAAKKTLGIGK
jgi:HdeA/HdeB family